VSAAGEHPLRGRFVVLGVTGGIAAYKAVEVCRRLVDAGAHVAPVLTESASAFIGAATFSALASEPAQTALLGAGHPIPHTRLGQRADLVLVAPATANLLAAYAAGLASDLLTATLLATRAPVLLCPAMHTEMWEHPAVQDNIARLRGRGVRLVEPASGRLAGGDTGTGRLAEPADIVAAAAALLVPTACDLAGARVLVTAGGTREPIDDVRYLANRSSGRQGHALAAEAAARGAEVVLVTAAELAAPAGVTRRQVDTAAELAAAVHEEAPRCDVVVMAAAVADFRPRRVHGGKWHKRDGVPDLVLEPTEDVLASLGRTRRPGQLLVGFAAEVAGSATALEEAARAKLTAKGADMIVANDVSLAGAGFAVETNAVTIVTRDGASLAVPLASKRTIAGAVLDAVVRLRAAAGRQSGQQGDDQL
jgi:phosphopantothenoylcysteine decarboxylase/phosphopantothenate--cysteine ligase